MIENEKKLKKKIDNKRIDDADHRDQVLMTKSEFFRTKSSNLAECKCKRIFNVD